MSLATRCTACGTIFRVVQDQLRVSEGWVRCGRCAEVFDAREQLFDLDREAPPPWPPGTAERLAEPARENAFVQEQALRTPHAAAPSPSARPAPPIPSAPPVPSHLAPHRIPEAPVEPPPAWQRDPAPMTRAGTAGMGRGPGLAVVEPDASELGAGSWGAHTEAGLGAEHQGGRREPFWEPAPAPNTPPEAPPATPHDAREDLPEPKGLKFDAHEPPAPASREAAAASAGTAGALPPNQDLGPDVVLSPRLKSVQAELAANAASPAPTTAPETPDSAQPLRKPGFLRRAEGEARWQRPGVRLALGLGSALLLLAAGAQLTWHYRDALATQSPLARQWLGGACEKLGCQLQAWRRLDAFSVESSGLSEAASGNHYKFSLSLRNKSPWELATPWVELSLNDGSGQLLMKKALRPEDFSNGRPSMGANSEQALQLVFSTGRQRVNGYTVEIFYP